MGEDRERELLAVIGEQEVSLRTLRRECEVLKAQLEIVAGRVAGALQRVPPGKLTEDERRFLAAVEASEEEGEKSGAETG